MKLHVYGSQYNIFNILKKEQKSTILHLVYFSCLTANTHLYSIWKNFIS